MKFQFGSPKHYFSYMLLYSRMILELTVDPANKKWRAGGANGATTPGIQDRGASEDSKLQTLKCYNQMIFPIVWLLTHPAWMQFFETCFFVNTSFTYSNSCNSHILQYRGPTL